MSPCGLTPPDRIELRGLRVLGTHGVLADEQTRAQPFEIDLDVECDLTVVGHSDDLRDTLDYQDLLDQVERVVAGDEHCSLLERLAQRIADVVLADPRANLVTVSVRKLRPPVPYHLATAGVRITRNAGGPS
jgi:dihydroneopterin aldolase